MSYTAAQMVDQLGLYLNKLDQGREKTPDEFTFAERELMLNRAQRKVASLITLDFFSELALVDEDKTVSSGKCAFSNLSQTPIYDPWGILGIKTNDDYFCEYIDFEEYKRLTNDQKTFSVEKPKWYIFGSYFYVLPTTGISTIDIYYIRKPVDINITTPTACELSDELQEIIIDYATFIGYAQRKDLERGNLFLELALNGINAINARIDPEHQVYTATSREAYLDWHRGSRISRGEADNK